MQTISKYSHLILLALALVGLWGYGCENLRNGVLQERVAGLEQRNARLEDESGRVDTVYRDSVVVRTKIKRVTDSVLLADTVIHTDTVRQIVEQERQACDAVVRTCEARVALRDQRIAVLDSLLVVERKRNPGWFKRTTSKVPWLVGGIILGRAIN